MSLLSPGRGHRPALPGGYGTGELGFGPRAQLGQSVHTALPHGSLCRGQAGTRLLCCQLLRATHSHFSHTALLAPMGSSLAPMGAHHQETLGGPPGEPRLQSLGRAGLHLLQTLTLLQLLLLSSTTYLSSQPCSQPGRHPWYSRKQGGV